MHKINHGFCNIKREFEIDQYLYRVKYTLEAVWDQDEGGWYTKDLTIEWIQRTEDNFETTYPRPCDIPKAHLKEIENITPEKWEYELCGERPEP